MFILGCLSSMICLLPQPRLNVYLLVFIDTLFVSVTKLLLNNCLYYLEIIICTSIYQFLNDLLYYCSKK